MAQPSTKEIANAILALSGRIPQAKLSKSVASYLQQERRSGELDAIMREVKELKRKTTGVTEADVTTAHPISSATKKHIKKLFGSDLQINEVIDKDVIGGVRVETNEEYLDLTVRNRLNQLKRTRQGVM